MNADLVWQKLKQKEFPAVEKLLRSIEGKYVSACGRFLTFNRSTDSLWALREKKGGILALIINSRSTIIPVLNGNNKIPTPSFLKSLYRRRKVHSIQGLRDEVLVIEGEMKKIGVDTEDIFNYDLMSLDSLPDKNGLAAGPSNLVLRAPKLTDIDDIASLQAAYEKEEVLPKGSAFSPAASRVNIANIMAKGHVLAAELDGRFVGKINISAVSFTRYQIGGVYVHPDYRGQGIAGRMAAEFASSLIKEGKGITLFVKKNNTPARKLYAALGFTVIGDYRITYY